MEVEIAWAAIPLAEFLLRVATTLRIWNLGHRGIRLRNKECYRSDYPERPRPEEYPDTDCGPKTLEMVKAVTLVML
jgi:hypothetical protein